MEKLKIGISIGDINGVGLEVILKALAHDKIKSVCVPVIYGSSKVVSYHKNIVGVEEFSFQGLPSSNKLHYNKINVINCWQENVNITLGKATEDGGKYAFQSLEAAVKDLKSGVIDALVTAPINKEAMNMAGFPFAGHTEYLTAEIGGKSSNSMMMLVNDTLKIGLVTNHLPLREVADVINKDLIIRKVKTLNDTLKMDFGKERPTIAVLALNPHASDGGVIGDEEEKIIRPAIVECKKKGIMVMGPYPADGFFGSAQYKKFDAVLAMYHDQGLIPFKALSFGNGVNFTAGLSCVRTSPDHGTAYDLAGRNEANPSSFRHAVFLAMDIARHRIDYLDMHENALVKRDKGEEVDADPAELEEH